MIIEVNPQYPSSRHIDRLAALLEKGEVISIPTDTCYALACLPQKRQAVERLIQLRSLDERKPRALVFSSLSHISEYAQISKQNFKLMRRVLPGPYCFILESNRTLPRFIGDQRQHIGVRCPDHKVVQALVEHLGSPITVTSAIDPEDQTLLYDPWSLKEVFGHGLAAIVDSGEVPGGMSSVIDLTDDQCEVIREGLGEIDSFT
jgi:tRNA threonylcarbamoyl adenosine modification protein (Sua5/YciO/YrdC/YwlC family)